MKRIVQIVAAGCLCLGTDCPDGQSEEAGEATFVLPQFTLSVTIQGNGSVTRAEGEGTVEVGVDMFGEGTEVTLTAIPADGWLFQQWQGDATGTESSTTVTMDGDRDITAVFVACECPPAWLSKTVELQSPDTSTQVVQGSGVLHRIWIARQQLGSGSDFDLTIRDANGVLVILTSVGQGPDLDVRFEGELRITKTSFPGGGASVDTVTMLFALDSLPCECPPVWLSRTVELQSLDTNTQVVAGSGVLHRIWIARQQLGNGSDFDLTIRDANGVLVILTFVGQGPDLDVRFEGELRITKTSFPGGGASVDTVTMLFALN